MNYQGAILKDIRAMLLLFKQKCEDDSILVQLLSLLDEDRWNEAHALFSVIRSKTLVATKKKQKLIYRQCLFEEICAKSIYNIGGGAAPFDPDSPYWILPNALALGRHLGVSDAEILQCITLSHEL